MLVLITYDVNTEDAAGRKRLRQIARQCVNYGQEFRILYLNACWTPHSAAVCKIPFVRLWIPSGIVCDFTI